MERVRNGSRSCALGGKEAGKIEPLHPSYPIMRRPRVDLEEKHEPRAATSAGRRAILGKEQAWHSESALTSAAIEKLLLAALGLAGRWRKRQLSATRPRSDPAAR